MADNTPKKTGLGLAALFGGAMQKVENSFTDAQADIITDGLTEETVREKGVIGAAIDLVKNMSTKSGFANRLMEIYSTKELDRILSDADLQTAIKKYCDEHPKHQA